MSVIDRLSKILNQAENAGTPEEGETFMKKAMEIASTNGIDLAVARAHQANKEKVEDPEERRIQINPYNRRSNRKHFMELAMAIADANDIEYLIGGKEHTLFAVGFPSDLDVMEALYVHLAVQMVTECDEALARGENKRMETVPKMKQTGRGHYEYEIGEDGHEIMVERMVPIVDGRIFRGDFYAAFVSRMRGRLWEIRRSVERERGIEPNSTTGTALALRDKKEEVAEAHRKQREKVGKLGSYTAAEDTKRGWDHSGRAHRSGTESAERVPVHEGREVKKS